MQNLTNGGMSVPVTVIDKGTLKQKVIVGYDDAAALLKLWPLPHPPQRS